MVRLLVAALALCGSSVFAFAADPQESPEVKRLKDENALLKAKLELLAKENELLKKEIELLKRGARGGAESPVGDKPTATVGGIKYTIEKAMRNGNQVSLQIVGVSEDDVALTFRGVEAVDGDGNVLAPKLGTTGFLTVKFKDGVKTKFEIVLPRVPAKVTEFARVDLTKGPSIEQNAFAPPDKQPVIFKNVKIGK